MDNKLIVTAAPHITSADSTQKIMQRVCIALVPTLIASVIIFGINSLILTAVTVAACVIFEYLYCKLVGREVAISDFSAVVTGMLLAFNLPATLPWWMAVVGAFFMATDYVTSPTTTKGKIVFGLGLGVITCAIRFLGTMNEGVSFAILLMNLLVPYIEILTRQDRLGIAKTKKKEGAAK